MESPKHIIGANNKGKREDATERTPEAERQAQEAAGEEGTSSSYVSLGPSPVPARLALAALFAHPTPDSATGRLPSTHLIISV